MAENIGQLRNTSGAVLCKMWMVNTAPRSRAFLPHRHREFEIALVMGGRGEYRTENRAYPINKNAVFLFCSNEIHCITEIYGEENLQILTLQFSPELISNYLLDYNGAGYQDLFYTHAAAFENRIADHPEIRARMLSLRREFQQCGPYHTVLIPLKICEILFLAARTFPYRTPPGRPAGTTDYTAKVMAHIQRHFAENIRMAELSRLAGVTPNYLSKVFKDTCGIPIWDYLAITRINHAKKLLAADPQANIMNIALDSGYNNTANFNKAFKKYTDMTPRQYRLRAKGKINIDI